SVSVFFFCLLYSFFCSASGTHRYLHSFPTRRSSDLHLARPGDHLDGENGVAAQREEILVDADLVELQHGAPHRGEGGLGVVARRSEEHTSELQSHLNLVCRLLLEKKNTTTRSIRFAV